KQLAFDLRDKEVQRSQIYTRPAEDLSVFMEQEEPNPVAHVNLFDLVNAFQGVLAKHESEPFTQVEREEISIDERMSSVKELLLSKKRLTFNELLNESVSRYEIVVTFLALLELMRKNDIYCAQHQVFDEIWISLTVGAVPDEN